MSKIDFSKPITWGLIYVLTVFAFGFLYYLLQGLSKPVSFWEAQYFSVVTITTLGYGDISPSKSLAMIFTASEVLLGVLLLGLFLFRLTSDLAVGVRQEEQKIALRQKWKPKFEEHIRTNFSEELRSDVIIRDVKRVDEYPELEENQTGISPWFRLSLVGTYHRGILVGFQWNNLVSLDDGRFRVHDPLKLDKDDDEVRENSVKVLKIGRIPFENIEDVDFGGDEYYGYPHIYCHFSNKNEPYEKVSFCTRRQLFPDSLPYYTEVADAEAVRLASLSAGVEKPYV